MGDAIRDDPSQDGTTAFAMALAKENNGIVKMFLDSKIEQNEEIEALLNASKKVGPDPSQPINKK
jgi:hypothetical protein